MAVGVELPEIEEPPFKTDRAKTHPVKIDDLEIKLGRHPNLDGQSKRESDSEKRRFNDSKVQELYNKAIKDVYSSQSSLDYANPPLKLDDLPTSK